MKIPALFLSACCMAALPLTAAAVPVELSNGDTLNADIIETADAYVIVNHPVVGQIRILKSQITNINDILNPTKEKATPKEQPKQDPAPPAEPELDDTIPGLFGTSLLRGWEKSFSLGLSGSTGNSETLNFNGGLTANFEDDAKSWDFTSAVFYSEADSKETKDQAYLQLIRDWKSQNTPWFVFAQGRYDYDSFQAYEHRISPSGGFGYQISDTKEFKLRATGGAGITYNFGDVDKRIVPEGNLGLSSTWIINTNNTITGNTQYFPGVEDPVELYRIVNNIEWKIKMDSARGLSLKLGILHEYNSQTDNADQSNNDLQYYSALVLEF